MGCSSDRNLGKQIVVASRRYCLSRYDKPREDQFNPEDKNLGTKILINKQNLPEFETGRFCEGTLTEEGAEYYLKYCDLTEKERLKKQQSDPWFFLHIFSLLCFIPIGSNLLTDIVDKKFTILSKSAIAGSIALGGVYAYFYYRDKKIGYEKLIENASTKTDNRI